MTYSIGVGAITVFVEVIALLAAGNPSNLLAE
jgi:hypothetical protein